MQSNVERLTRVRAELGWSQISKLPVERAFELQDRLPKAWRELIYDFGQSNVFMCIQQGFQLDNARSMLGARKVSYSKPTRRCRR